jgi:group I intron endonuclease
MTYIYTLSDGERIRYVGKTKFITKRYNSHINESKNKKTYKEKWINNVLINNGKIVIEILDICDDDISDEIESYWIHQMKCWGFNLVNLTLGGDGGSPMLGKNHSEKTKIKMSKTAKNQNRTIGGWNKGLKMSDEFKKKISTVNKGRITNENTKIKISNKLKGIKRQPMSEETKKKISEKKKGQISPNKGKKINDEIRKKMSLSRIGKKRNKSSIEKQSQNQKIIWVIKTPSNDILKFLGYNSFIEYVKENKLSVSVSTLKSYGKNKGWEVIDKIKNNL